MERIEAQAQITGLNDTVQRQALEAQRTLEDSTSRINQVYQEVTAQARLVEQENIQLRHGVENLQKELQRESHLHQTLYSQGRDWSEYMLAREKQWINAQNLCEQRETTNKLNMD